MTLPNDPDQVRRVIEELTRHPSKRVWKTAQDLGNALNLWPDDGIASKLEAEAAQRIRIHMAEFHGYDHGTDAIVSVAALHGRHDYVHGRTWALSTSHPHQPWAYGEEHHDVT